MGLSLLSLSVLPPFLSISFPQLLLSLSFSPPPSLLLSLDIVGRNLVLPQCNVSDFVDSQIKSYPLGGVDGGQGRGKV